MANNQFADGCAFIEGEYFFMPMPFHMSGSPDRKFRPMAYTL